MSDVLQTAKNYREKLLREIARLEDFLRMANELAARHAAEPSRAKPVNAAEASVKAQPRIEQPEINPAREARVETPCEPKPEQKEPNGHKLGLSFRNVFGPAELDRNELLA